MAVAAVEHLMHPLDHQLLEQVDQVVVEQENTLEQARLVQEILVAVAVVVDQAQQVEQVVQELLS